MDTHTEQEFEAIEFDEQLLQDEESTVSAAPAWIISLAVHAVLLLVLAAVIIYAPKQLDPPPIVHAIIEQQPLEEKEPPKEIELEPVDTPIDPDEIVPEPEVVVDLIIEPEDIPEEETPEETDVPEPKGRPDNVATQELASNAFMNAIGANSNAMGPLGNIRGSGKKRALRDNGGTPGSESAVNAALMWFKRHQSENGMWDVDGYMDNCQEDVKCEPGRAHSTENGDGDTACSAYALLCFLGAGYDHKTPGKYQDTVRRGLDWLLSQQNDDGSFGVQQRNYENAVCTMALCDAYALTMDPKLKVAAQTSVDHLINRQAKSDTFNYGCGWYYKTPNIAQNDASVSGWAVMALKVAKQGGLDVGDAWEGSKQYVEAAWKAANPQHQDFDSYARSSFPYRFNADTLTAEKNRLACVGAVCSVYQGKRPGDVMLDTLMNTITETQIPTAYPCNTYYLYYNTLAAFQYGGEPWKKWNMQVRDLLIDAQQGNETGCFYGSWDFEGTKFHGHETGRLLSTAYCCLSLEVYYRDARVRARRN